MKVAMLLVLLLVVLPVVVYWLLREYAQLWNFPWRKKAARREEL